MPPQTPPPQRQQALPSQAPRHDHIDAQSAIKSASTVAASSGKEFTLDETLRWATAFLNFIETGKVEAPDWVESLPVGAPREPGEDDGSRPQDPPY